MKQAINTIKSWFQTGDKPTQGQFHDWLDSFWHKDDIIPIASVDGLSSQLSGLATQAALDALKAIVLTTSSVTASVSLPAGTILNKIRVKSTGAQTISVGTTPGGNNILAGEVLSPGQVGLFVVDIDIESATTIHFSGLSGNNSIKIYLQQ